MSDEVYDFGLRLRQLREDRGLSMKDFAEKLGISKNSVFRYEHNLQDPSVARVKKMATILHTSLDYLLGFDNTYMIKCPPLTLEQRNALNDFLRAFISDF